MKTQAHSAAERPRLDRRQALAALAAFAGSLALSSQAQAKGGGGGAGGGAGGPGGSSSSSHRRSFLHYEVDFNATSERVYNLLTDSKQFLALTGQPAEIDPTQGGAFSMFGGLIVGRNIELVPNERIVQAWRPTHWDPGVYSIVKFDLRPMGSRTHLTLDHTGFPVAEADKLDEGWKGHYLKPMAKYLA